MEKLLTIDKYSSIKKVKILPISFFLFGILFFPPILLNSYITIFLYVFLLSILTISLPLINGVVKIPVIHLIPYFLLGLGGIFSILSSMTELNSIWNLRDAVRIFVALLLFISFYSYMGYRKLEIFSIHKRIFLFLAAYILIEGIFAFTWFVDRSLISFLSYYNEFSDRGFTIGNYWRYLGLQGNPNFTAMFVACGLLYIWHMKKDICRDDKLMYIFTYLSLLFGGLALLATTSRTVFAALGLSIFISTIVRLKFKNVVGLFFMGGVIAFMIVYLSNFIALDDATARIMGAFDYAENERLNVAVKYLEFLNENVSVFLFGTFSSNLPLPFTDNDYLFFIIKYGLLGLLFIILILLLLIVNGFYINQREKNKPASNFGKFLTQFTIYLGILAIGSVPFSHPGTLFLIIFFHVISICQLQNNKFKV